MDYTKLFDLVFDVLDEKISVEEVIKQIENTYETEVLLSVEEENCDVLWFITTDLILKKMKRDFKEPLDFTFLEYILKKGGNVNKVYDQKMVNSFLGGQRLQIKGPNKDSSLLELVFYIKEDLKLVEKDMTEKLGDSYIGITNLYSILNEYSSIKEEFIVENDIYETETTSSIVFGVKYNLESILYKDYVSLVRKIQQKIKQYSGLICFSEQDLGSLNYEDNKLMNTMNFVVGYRIVINECEVGCPSFVDSTFIKEKINTRGKIFDNVVDNLRDFLAVNTQLNSNPNLYLITSGPLSYGAIVKGQITESINEDVYFGMDQKQDKHTKGVRGELLYQSRSEIVMLDHEKFLNKSEMYLISGYDM